MATNNGLFMTPEQVQALQAQQRTAHLQTPVNRSMFNLGNELANVANRGFTGNSNPNPAVEHARNVQQLMKDVDFQDRNSILQGVNRLNNAGLQQEALTLFKQVPDAPDPGKPLDQWTDMPPIELPSGELLFWRKNNLTGKSEQISKGSAPKTVKTDDQWITLGDETLPNGQIVRTRLNRNTGRQETVFVSSKPNAESTNAYDPSKLKFKQIRLDEIDKEGETNWWFKDSGVGAPGLWDNYEVDDLKPILQDQVRIANALKREAIQEARSRGDTTFDAIDSEYLMQARRLMMEDPEAWFNEATVGSGSKVKLRTNSRVTLDSLRRSGTNRLLKEKAEEGAENAQLPFPSRHPNSTGYFHEGKLNTTDAFNLFSNPKSPQQVLDTLTDQGFFISQKQRDKLTTLTSFMIEMPSFTRKITSGGITKQDVDQLKYDLGKVDLADATQEGFTEHMQKLAIVKFFEQINYD